MNRRTIHWTWIMTIATYSGWAQADVVSPPPADCPEGSSGAVSHAGPFCAAIDCSADASKCGVRGCESRSICLEDIEGVSAGGPFTVKNVKGPCAADGTCAVGTCTTLSVCVAASGTGGVSGNGTGGDQSVGGSVGSSAGGVEQLVASGGDPAQRSLGSGAAAGQAGAAASDGSGCNCRAAARRSSAVGGFVLLGWFVLGLRRLKSRTARGREAG